MEWCWAVFADWVTDDYNDRNPEQCESPGPHAQKRLLRQPILLSLQLI